MTKAADILSIPIWIMSPIIIIGCLYTFRLTRKARRLADEGAAIRARAQALFDGVSGLRPIRHLPIRGNDVEVWIKSRRDAELPGAEAWMALDDALDDYRLHADTGLPLNQDAEGR